MVKDGFNPVIDGFGYVSIPNFEKAIVGYSFLKQATVYDIDMCRTILYNHTEISDPYELECKLSNILKKAEIASGITPLFIEVTKEIW